VTHHRDSTLTIAETISATFAPALGFMAIHAALFHDRRAGVTACRGSESEPKGEIADQQGRLRATSRSFRMNTSISDSVTGTVAS